MSRTRAVGPEPIEGRRVNTEVTPARSQTMYPSQPYQSQASSTSHHANLSPSRANNALSPGQKFIDFSIKKLRQLKPCLHDPKQQRFPKHQWPELGISCGELDFETGKLTTSTAQSENGQSFLKLMAPEAMQQIAVSCNLHHIRGPIIHGPEALYTNFHNADALENVVLRCLWTPYVDNKSFLVQKSVWEDYRPDNYEGPKLHNMNGDGDVMWIVPWFLQSKGSASPHVNCILIQQQRLEQDTLLLSEVWCILMLSLLIARRLPAHLNYRTVPVTMVSASSRYIRIVQGWVDSEAGKIRINKSLIVSLGTSESMSDKTVWAVVSDILRWLLAEPTGKTA
ncbi:hypothetical protein F5Y01DRAFT_270154 [Xylaria sp. FL0043]|nr:hypothetical protein F5Y01DRAFT_270154 [Xylaria sp. FL0043]